MLNAILRAMLAVCAGAVLILSSALALTAPAQADPTNTCFATYSGPAATVFLGAGNVCAAPTLSGGDSRWDTRGYVGLSFSIGDGFNPHLDVGVRETNVSPTNLVYGGEANVSISLVKGLKDTQLRLLAIAGSADFANTDLLANAGLGWDVGKNSLLLNAGLQVPYARAFLDYTISDASFRAFL